MIQRSQNVTAIGKTFPVGPPSLPVGKKNGRNHGNDRIEVDVVCDHGATWCKIKVTNIDSLHSHWMGHGKEKKDLISQASRSTLSL